MPPQDNLMVVAGVTPGREEELRSLLRSMTVQPARCVTGMPQFVTVRGGGYFFLPGLRALRYIAALDTAPAR